MAGLILDGAETLSRTGSVPNPWQNGGYRAFPINPTTGVPVRATQVSYLVAYFNPGYSNHGDALFSGGAQVCSYAVQGDGTPQIWRGTPFAGVLLKAGVPGTVPPGQYTMIRFDVNLAPNGDVTAGTAKLYVNGVLKVEITPTTIGAGSETYFDGIRFSAGSVSVVGSPLHTTPNGRHGSYAFDVSIGGYGDSYRDDLLVCAPSALLDTVVVGTGLVPGVSVLHGTTSGATLTVSDFDDSSSFQGMGGARVWGADPLGAFQNGEVITDIGSASGFTGLARVGAGFDANGLEQPSRAPINLFVFPVIPTADDVVALTPNADANWQNAAQIPPGPDFNENATAGTLADTYVAGCALVDLTDTIIAMEVCADAQSGGAPIVNGYTTWTDGTGTNTATTQPLPGGAYNQVISDIWGTRADLTTIPPGDIIATNLGVGLAT